MVERNGGVEDAITLSRRKFLRKAATATAAVAGGTMLFGSDIASAFGCASYVGPINVDDPVSFNEIGGVGFYYGTNTDVSGRHTYTADRPFKNRLEDWIADLTYFSGWGQRGDLQKIGGGGLTSASGSKCHPLGQAFDLNWIQWGLGDGATFLKPYAADHEAATQTRRRLYLAVDAVSRMTFKYVLDGWYEGHSTHMHLDMDRPPKLSRNIQGSGGDSGSADTFFVQAVCNRFNGAGLNINGVWNDDTQTAWKRINEKWGYNDDDTGSIFNHCNPQENTDHYRAWLSLVARHGFADEPAGTYVSGTC